MGDLIFTKIPFYNNDYLKVSDHNKLATPDWAKNIEQSDLIKSITKYGDLYANDDQNYLSGICIHEVFRQSHVLHLAFKEPFDDYNSMSIIQIWGNAKTQALARENLVKHVINLWEYEELLGHYYFSDTAPFNKYCYFIYDPQELAHHHLTRETNTHDGSRPGLNPCGLIYTNATLMNTKTR
jgi:hypothetical protein